MVKTFLTLTVLLSTFAYADIFDFASGPKRESRIPGLIEKLKSFDMKDGPTFDENFNQTVKLIENAVEEEKLFCAGEVADSEGKTLPAAQKQLCIRELKKRYLDSMDTIFDLKKKYLNYITQKQQERLGEIQKKLKADIEKSF